MGWAMRKKGLLELMVQAVMSLDGGAKTRVRIGSANLGKFEVRVCVHQGFVLSPLFATKVDVITKKARRHVIIGVLYADDLVLIAKPWKI